MSLIEYHARKLPADNVTSISTPDTMILFLEGISSAMIGNLSGLAHEMRF